MREIIQQYADPGNYAKGRHGHTADVIVDHVTQGDAASARSWFAKHRPDDPTCAHYMVTIAGTLDQFVSEDDTAYANGILVRPSAPIVLERPGISPNWYTISIEHEGDGTQPLRGKQLDASIELHLDIIARRKIPVSRRHIIRHDEIRANKACPGKISVDEIVALLARESGIVTPPAPAVVVSRQPAPDVVWSEYLVDWLIPVDVRSDTDWTFVRMRHLRGAVWPPERIRSTTPLSKMPRSAPVTP